MTRCAMAKVLAKSSITREEARELCVASLVRMGCAEDSVTFVARTAHGVFEDRGEQVNLFANDLVLWEFSGRSDGDH